MLMRKVISVVAIAAGFTLAMPQNASAATSIQTKAYNVAKAQIGDRYSWGATGPNAFDCSGLTWYSYDRAGKNWSRQTAHNQRRNQTKDITVKQRVKGDLIFFRRKGSSTYTHVGIYAGSGYMINAVNGNTYKGVRKGKVNDGYWNKYYVIDYRRVK